jgi:hypothetical protein
MLHAGIVPEMVIYPTDFGFAGSDELVPVAKFHKVVVCATA